MTFAFADPPTWGGVVAVMVVLLTTMTRVAVAKSKLTVAPEMKFVPVIVTGVPPAEGLVAGLIEVTVAPEIGGVPPVVKLQTGPLLVRLAIVLEAICQR